LPSPPIGHRPGKGARREVHVRGEQLIAYIDGEADDALKQHIEACASCRARLEPYIALQGDLLRALFRVHCPCSQALGDYHLGLLAEAEASAVKEHMAECPYCMAEIETLKQFLAESEVSADYRKSNAQELLRQHKLD
jgi:anti-sigma factor RsiW